jgi:apolipoprotein N-acyltransferase
MKSFLALFILSFFIVAFGQEDFIPFLGPIAAVCGFALFWQSLFYFDSIKKRFYASLVWFFSVQLIKLLWFANPEYLGPWIVVFYLFASLFIATQFALACLIVKKEMNWLYILMCASVFTLMEYSRVHILMGFTWNPTGLALSSFLYTMQAASIAGIYGLSFLVFATNLTLLSLFSKVFNLPKLALLICLIMLPYVYGFLQISILENTAEDRDKSLKALLVQTAILQADRIKTENNSHSLSPLEQWGKIINLIKPYHSEHFDLIVLPEGVVPYPAFHPLYTHLSVVDLFYKNFGRASLKYLPNLQEPYATWIIKENEGKGFWAVGNAFIAQGIANVFKADLVGGFEVIEKSKKGVVEGFQSLLLFKHGKTAFERYDKQVLVPVGESLPFAWCEKLANYFGVMAFFTPGNEMKVLKSSVTLGPSVCYEETYGHILLDSKRLGAKCLVNITNDGWFPGIRLIKQHFSHAKVRCLELGLPLVRACTTGVTAAVDAFGREVKKIKPTKDPEAEALNVELPLLNFTTLYEKVGDSLIVFMSIGFIGLYLISNRKNINFTFWKK